jgi:hypothetical protein
VRCREHVRVRELSDIGTIPNCTVYGILRFGVLGSMRGGAWIEAGESSIGHRDNLLGLAKCAHAQANAAPRSLGIAFLVGIAKVRGIASAAILRGCVLPDGVG